MPLPDLSDALEDRGFHVRVLEDILQRNLEDLKHRRHDHALHAGGRGELFTNMSDYVGLNRIKSD